MSCQRVRREITEAFAAGGRPLSPEASGHVEACAACRDFYNEQQKLFRLLDNGLRALANHAVPPSLLPRVRAGLDQAPVVSRSWMSGWSLAVLACAVVLAVVLPQVRQRPQPPAKTQGTTQTVARSVENPPADGYSTQSVPPSPVTRRHSATRPAGCTAQVPPAALEVIVLAEERDAFARFVAKLPVEQDVAVALTRPAPENADRPIEIALLQIKSLEVKPLEATEE
jgi:hypothetical protein